MDDYIKREDAIENIDELYFSDKDDHDRMREAIKRLSAADVVEVVRCKDCKNYKKDIPCVGGKYNGCSEWIDEGCESPVNENDFCSYGERADK